MPTVTYMRNNPEGKFALLRGNILGARNNAPDPVLLHEEYMEGLEQVSTIPYYHYTFSNSIGNDRGEYPGISPDYLDVFYSNIQTQAKIFWGAQQRLLDSGIKLSENIGTDQTIDTMLQRAPLILENTNSLIYNFQQINQAEAKKPKNIQKMKEGLQKKAFLDLIESLGSKKPECFRTILRCYIPRWITFPLTFPHGVHPDESEYDETHFLIHPDDMKIGRRPLHMIFQEAEKKEKEGKDDIGYLLRTYGILQVLTMEQINLDAGAEIPFFTFILPYLMIGKDTGASKKIYFDYQKAIRGTMRDTFLRYNIELERGEKGIATQFINKLALQYQGHFSDILARAIVNQGNETYELDIIPLLRNIQQSCPPYLDLDMFMETLNNMPKRRALITQEMTELAERLNHTQSSESLTVEGFIGMVASIVGNEDSYSFTVPLDKIGIRKDRFKGDIEIDLERIEETIYAKITLDEKGTIRSIPFTLSYSGEPESMAIDTVDKQDLPQDAIETYRTLISFTLQKELEKVKAREESRKSKQRPDIAPLEIESERIARKMNISGMTRRQRIEMYNKLSREKATRESSQTENQKLLPGNETNEVGVTTEPQRKNVEFALVGIEPETIAEVLRNEGIQGVTPDQIIKKLDHIFKMASSSDKNRPPGEVVRSRIREIKWNRDSNDYRIFIGHIGNGVFSLRHIWCKSGQVKIQTGVIDKVTKDFEEYIAEMEEKKDS
ncbi:MAG: hypothetical protein Q7S61_04570 [bacterium]|nr:hypothetical protein [bacterium]